MNNIGVVSVGLRCPIIREGDNVVETVFNAVKDYGNVNDYDVIGITESVISRAHGLYCTVDDVAKSIEELAGKKEPVVVLDSPIYSRNRFAIVLKGIARASKTIVMYMPIRDEVGNPSGVNPFTGVNIEKYYREIVEGENCEFITVNEFYSGIHKCDLYIDCSLHTTYELRPRRGSSKTITLASVCADKNPDFGVLGSNKATEEKLKLFPTKEMANYVCNQVQERIYAAFEKHVIVCCYGDGCFKSLEGEIWECADPTTMPGFTDSDIILSTPNEIKIKAFADDKFGEIPSGENLDKAVRDEISSKKKKSLVGDMKAQGTTPRLYRDLLASLMDLTTGSGDKGTPIVIIHNYFKNFSD